MAKMTKTEKIIQGLLANGHEEMPCKSGKYRQFTFPGVPDKFLFVGKRAAVRMGTCATKSYSVTDSKFVKKILTKVDD